jgi:phage protein D
MSAPSPTGAIVAAPTIQVGTGQAPLTEAAAGLLVRTVVDTDLHLPGMFELTFADVTGDLLQRSGFELGTPVRVLGHALGERTDELLVAGEVTSIEGRCQWLKQFLVIRGHDPCHRLQRVRRTSTYVNTTYSDIATQLARAAGLTDLEIEPSATVHDHVGQVDQTDWDFLKQRAREIGYEVGMSGTTFHFRKASSMASASGPPIELTFRQDIRLFRPRVTAGNLAPKVEVRVWDPLQAKVVNNVATTETGSVEVDGQDPASAAGVFVKDTPAAAGTRTVGADLGPPPQGTGYVVHDRPVAIGAAIDSAATAVTRGLAEHVGSTFAEADGEAYGKPKLQAGAVVKVIDVEPVFSGPWVITSARHVFDVSEAGYTTSFVASGRHDRSLLGLASVGGTQSPAAKLPGLYCGVVTNNNDPQKVGRVKVALPWLSPEYETDWSPVAQVGAGRRSGALFLPEVGDEVLAGFEFGDARRPYVIGGIMNNHTTYSLGAPPVKATGESADVVLRGFVSAAGNRLVFNDEIPPGNGNPPTASVITLGTGDSALSLAIDQVTGTVTLTCKPAPPNSKTEKGTINIQCGDGGTINIATGVGGSVTVDGGADLTVKAQKSITVQSSGELALRGSKITLN